MLITITAESETAVGNKSKAIIFRWELTLEQLNRLNEVASELAEGDK